MWGEVEQLLCDPTLIRAEIERRLTALRTESPAAHRRDGLERARLREGRQRPPDRGLPRTAHHTRRAPRPHADAAQTRDHDHRTVAALDAELHDAETYLQLAENLEGFLARLAENAQNLTVEERQRVVQLVVREVLIGDDGITIRTDIIPTPTGPDDPNGVGRAGAVLSPLIANVALSALDEHFARAWEATGGQHGRQARRRRGEANYRIVRYADDFVIVVAGERRHAEALIADTEQVIRPLGLALSTEKTSIAHIDEGIEFLGWRIQRQTRRKGRPQIYTYPSKPSLQAVTGKVKQITRTGPNQTLDQLLNRLNPVLRGWCDHFRHGVSSRTFGYLRAYVWRRVIIWLRHKHHGRNWRWLRRRYLPGWWPTAQTVSLYNPAGVKVTRYRYRGSKIPTPWEQPDYEQLSFDLERLEALIAR